LKVIGKNITVQHVFGLSTFFRVTSVTLIFKKLTLLWSRFHSRHVRGLGYLSTWITGGYWHLHFCVWKLSQNNNVYRKTWSSHWLHKWSFSRWLTVDLVQFLTPLISVHPNRLTFHSLLTQFDVESSTSPSVSPSQSSPGVRPFPGFPPNCRSCQTFMGSPDFHLSTTSVSDDLSLTRSLTRPLSLSLEEVSPR
jgi:hypothetical protein